MSRSRSRFVLEGIADYALSRTSRPEGLVAELQETTEQRTGPASVMQIGDDQAELMEILVRAMGAKNAVEVGTFTGYSALVVARGLGPDGRLLCCDVSEEWTSIARDYWVRAGVAGRIDLRIGPAIETLRSLPAGEQFDFCFIDADKTGYADYYDELVPRVRPGGLLLADNTLQGGRVTDDSVQDASVLAIRAFNDRVAADPRVRVVLLPVGDGVSVIQKL